MSNILDNAVFKYNWWTNDKDKENISDYIKISYIFCNGNIIEIAGIFREFSYELLLKAFDYVKNDNFALKEKRRKAINYLLILKKNGDI